MNEFLITITLAKEFGNEVLMILELQGGDKVILLLHVCLNTCI